MELGPFESSRLTYRAIEIEDEAFLMELGTDYEAHMNSFPGLPKPISKAGAKSSREWFEKQLLSVLICLREPQSATSTAPSSTNTDTTPADQSTASASIQPKLPAAIGFISLRNSDPIFLHHRASDIGISLLAQYRGKGYGREAIEWSLAYGFHIAGLHRIGIGCFEWNDGARRLYTRMGFVPEGSKRKSLWFKGRWYDLLEFGMLEVEWMEREQEREKEREKGAMKEVKNE